MKDVTDAAPDFSTNIGIFSVHNHTCYSLHSEFTSTLFLTIVFSDLAPNPLGSHSVGVTASNVSVTGKRESVGPHAVSGYGQQLEAIAQPYPSPRTITNSTLDRNVSSYRWRGSTTHCRSIWNTFVDSDCLLVRILLSIRFPGPLSTRFRLHTSDDPQAAAAGCTGVDIVLSHWAKVALLDWIPVNSRLCAVRLATFVKESHKRDVDRRLFIVSAYASMTSSDAGKDMFYDTLNTLLRVTLQELNFFDYGFILRRSCISSHQNWSWGKQPLRQRCTDCGFSIVMKHSLSKVEKAVVFLDELTNHFVHWYALCTDKVQANPYRGNKKTSVFCAPETSIEECVQLQKLRCQSIKDPISEKLLPDPVQPPYYQPPYTLVLELNGILVHPDWKFRTGWRFKKRPALELFLQQLSPYYEVVAFTNESAMTGGPVLMQLDPQGQYIHYRLFREATRYRNGKHIKDLSCLNRDLSHVILIDWDPSAASLQPRNALIVKKWQGDEADRELIDLAAFLRKHQRFIDRSDVGYKCPLGTDIQSVTQSRNFYLRHNPTYPIQALDL
ncbi:mitochondrial import inner membrane translocase subunit TIM50 [Clonorchis sinensis]|uniref:Mitochondrial import inner membrane translocase subunit TIM50 n=1 Tax=Clonorchis sinensis TaxID=79923 RepID=G7YVX2_CLOSI|nr:mitochondrial import inner membrane translocase subunit TIM50 [Clonorchis sinensis]